MAKIQINVFQLSAYIAAATHIIFTDEKDNYVSELTVRNTLTLGKRDRAYMLRLNAPDGHERAKSRLII
ncbi:hypothetical protein [Anabaena sp. CA = ATCC 33047]|uniref:hypothetical protein n=1 Tax=Anabaena sp. (strain CA / ATCC 33047) TaxID=52271 RepID=UPI000836F957|nr:hypothetical protein [Anabaena sp. CA = ATCC 33047]